LAIRGSFRRTKIVATLGPASASPKTIAEMIAAGVDAFRLNFSHGDHASHARLLLAVRRASKAAGRSVAIIQDLQGPRFRVGPLGRECLELLPGGAVRLVGGRGSAGGPLPAGQLLPAGEPQRSRGASHPGSAEMIPILPAISFAGFKVGQRVTIGERGVMLRVASVGRGALGCKVVRGGEVLARQAVNFAHAGAILPSLTRKDLIDLRFGISRGVDFIALSFVRSARDVLSLRERLRGTSIGVVSKIETQEAIRNIAEVIEASDAVLVARGDLAREVSIAEIPVLQKFLIERCNHMAKPVVTATQMLESMVANPEPTRAEASDVANAVLDGSDALMLSGETAAGKYPVEAVRVMDSLVRTIERARQHRWIGQRPRLEPEHHIDEMIAYLAAGAAESLGASAIITFTMSGTTALRVAKFRPTVPIFAVTSSAATKMRLAISYGTTSEHVASVRDTDGMVAAAVAAARRRGIVKKGDVVAVTAGVPPYARGKTNLLKLEVV
jgi:pyruvate kinase